MSKLTERELNRLSFLMASLVASPELSSRLTQRVLDGESAQEPFGNVVREVARRITAAATQGPPTKFTLRDVAKDLMIAGRDDELVTAGRLLAAALESARIAV